MSTEAQRQAKRDRWARNREEIAVHRRGVYKLRKLMGVCAGPFEQVDHVKPLAKGGPHMLANLRPSCAPCNNRKRARWPLDKEDLRSVRSR